MTLFLLWSFAALGAAIYCIARAIVDLRRRKYVWAAAGLVSALVFLLTPVQTSTQAVKFDLPAAPRTL